METETLEDLIADLKEITILDVKYGSEKQWKRIDELINLINTARLEKRHEN